MSVFTAEQEVLELFYLEDDEYTAVANLATHVLPNAK